MFGKWNDVLQQKYFKDGFDSEEYQIIYYNNQEFGCLSVSYINNEVFIYDLLISKEFQGKGIGSKIIKKKIISLRVRKMELIELLNDSDDSSKSLHKLLKKQNDIKKLIMENADAEDKAYQKYIYNYKQWKIIRAKMQSNETSPNTVQFYTSELTNIDSEYPTKHATLREVRIEKVKEILVEKAKIVDIYADIYAPIELELIELLRDMTERVDFKASVVLTDIQVGSKMLDYVNRAFAGVFNGKDKAFGVMNGFIRDTDFTDEVSMLKFIANVMKVVDENIDKASEIIKDKTGFYELLFGLDYTGVEFNLNYSGRDLKELSPGERGIVLLIFYLALNKGEKPLIIDQPEDNLDNESVYLKLVPCIQEAKKRHQVIIVTHNPNIAIACDAEQVIYCHIDKTKNEITYDSGSIENPVIKQKIIDVLEGTKPTFELRSKKYNFRKWH